MGNLTKTLKITEVLDEAEQAFYQGKYEQGLEVLSLFWNFRDPISVPIQLDLENKVYGEFLYQCGVLYGFYGTSQKASQKWSKDLLTKAFEVFSTTNNHLRTSQSANYLAISYQRSGALEEAKVWVDLAYQSINPLEVSDRDVYLEIILTELLISFSEKTFDNSLHLLTKNEKVFQECSNFYTLAHFYNHRGIVRRNLKLDGAVNDYRIASNLFNEINHWRFLSTAQNNLAWAYISLDQYDEALSSALESLDTAIKTDDLRQIGSVYDTIAQFKFIIRNNLEAVGFANSAIDYLKQTEAYEYLVEAYQTKIKALFELDRCEEAKATYDESIKIARLQTSASIVKKLNDVYQNYSSIDKNQGIRTQKNHTANSEQNSEQNSELIADLKMVYDEAVFNGEFEQGLKKLTGLWNYKRPHQNIKLKSFYSKQTQAELHLVCGDLYARMNIGKTDCQTYSIRFIKHALEVFIKIGDLERASLCSARLGGIHYWLGKADESRKYVENAYKLNPNQNETKLYIVIVDALTRYGLNQYEEMRSILLEYEKDFVESGNRWLQAQFYNYRGIIRYQLGLPGVISDFKISFEAFLEVKNLKCQIQVINNVGFYYMDFGKFEQSEKEIRQALDMAMQFEDYTLIGAVLDSIATVLYEAGKNEESLKYAAKSVEYLEKVDSAKQLLEAYQIKMKALYSLDRVAESLSVFSSAMELTKQRKMEKERGKLTTVYAEMLQRQRFLDVLVESEESSGSRMFDLNLPKELETDNILVVQVSSDAFGEYGIKKGYYMVVKKIDHTETTAVILNLIAVSKLSDNSIKLGYGEFVGEELLLYQKKKGRVSTKYENDFLVLGEVVGYFRGQNHKDTFIPIKDFRLKDVDIND